MIREATAKLISGEHLTYPEASAVMDEIMRGEASQVQTAAFLAALSAKGETIEEITAFAAAMRSHSERVRHGLELLEIVGTGGDGSGSFNISTVSAIVAASGGARVAKHGNRAASSKCGSADCLEALGVKISLPPERCLELLEEIGICFFFAPLFHPSMKHVAPVRRELGLRTVFNILGPLTNPASAQTELLGVFSESLVEPLARVMANLGVKRGMVVCGRDKLDEISLSSPTFVCEFEEERFTSYTLRPEDLGFGTCEKADLAGGGPEENARIALEILEGKKGPRRDAVLLNAGAGLYLAGKAATPAAGAALAAELIDCGAARAKLDEFIAKSNS